jgi:uncharacterized protein DUF4154
VGILGLFALVAVLSQQSQTVPLEYQLKAGYLFNFVKFVEWPIHSPSGVLTICVAGRNPFGDVLMEILRGETVNNTRLASRVIVMPEPDCDVVFVPDGVSVTPYLRAARRSPTLTVGETPDFINQGGIVNFVLEGGKVRFQISPQAADRAELRISSHLLRLARIPGR